MISTFSLTVYVVILSLLSATCQTKVDIITVEDQLQQLRLGLRESYEALTKKLMFQEIKIKEQETLLVNLQQSLGSCARPSEIKQKSTGEINIYKTCREMFQDDFSLKSGMYWIDPDGQDIGDDPIYVYCDTRLSSTSVLHDSESVIDVGHCSTPGCYNRTINYNSTSNQINKLIELSGECHQSIQYRCLSSPFESDDVTYSWWNDVNGIKREFWSGSDPNNHICQCGIDKNCVGGFQCNCDASQQIFLEDDGVITDKSFLPISSLFFGQAQKGAGLHALGRLICSGQQVPTINGMPASCADLQKIGYTLSGLHLIKGTNYVETVACNFQKSPDDDDFQVLVGYTDVKSSPTYFYVQKTGASMTLANTPITFDSNPLNVGDAMDKSTGKFTAPRTGNYFFSFSGLARLKTTPSTEDQSSITVGLKGSSNGVIGEVQAQTDGSKVNDMISMQLTINLQKNEQIWLEIVELKNAVLAPTLHFTGWLLQEDLS